MNFRASSFLFLFAALLMLNCSTGPDFERDSSWDPKSNKFMPDVGNLSVSIDSTKIVRLEWNDKSDFEDGFIIQKSYDNKNSFFDLDTLDANTTTYFDRTKKLAVNTFYKVRPFSDDSDSLGSTEIDELVLDPLKSIDVPDTPGNEIPISWETNDYGYADAYLIEKSYDNENWSVLDTVNNLASSYSLKEKDDFFRIYIRISALLNDFKTVSSRINTIQKKVEFNFPFGFEINQVNEAYLDFEWDHDRLNNYSYIIYSRGINTSCCDHPPTEWLPIDTVSNLNATSFVPRISFQDYDREFSIVAMNEDGELSRKSETSRFGFWGTRIPIPHSLSIESISSTEVKLTWGVYNSELATEYQISISENNGDFNLYKKLDPTDFEIIVDELDSTKTYNFKIKTYRSPSEYLEINFEPDLVLLKSYAFSISKEHYSPPISTENRLYFRNRVIDLSTLEMSNFTPAQHLLGLTEGNDFIYYSYYDQGVFKIQIFDKTTLNLLATKTFENKSYLVPKFIQSRNEILLSYTDLTTENNEPLIEFWNSNLTLLKNKINLKTTGNYSCFSKRLIKLLPDPSEKFALVACGDAIYESEFNSEDIVKIDLTNFTKSDVIFPNNSSIKRLKFLNDNIIFYISGDNVVKYDLSSNSIVSSIDLLKYGDLFDLRFSKDMSKIYTIGTQSGYVPNDSYFYILDPNNLSILDEIVLDGRMYFALELTNNRFFISGQANETPRNFSGIFKLKNGWVTK